MRSSVRHSSAAKGGPGGWIILDEPELHLGEDILVPDLGGWRLQTMHQITDAAYFEIAPDWVCEVLSSGPTTLPPSCEPGHDKLLPTKPKQSAQGRNRTADTGIFSPLLYRLSYLGEAGDWY